MTLPTPTYIANTDLQDLDLRYAWDQWNEEQAEDPIDEVLVTSLQRLSQRAILAFMCGAVEWIVFRFDTLCSDSAPNEFIEAAWAKSIHTRYSGYGSTTWQEYTGETWTNPVQGPLRRALDRVEIAMQQMAWEYEDPISRAGVLDALIAYVMPDKAPYNEWRCAALSRLERLYPRDPSDPLGDVVPREAVDPAYNFNVSQTETLINQFLARLDYKRNQFLSPPSSMLEPPDDDDEDDSFTGIPYSFNIKQDRRTRSRL